MLAPERPLPVYLTPRQVAEALQVNERTVLRWAAEDATMPVVRLGRVVRFERQAVLRWLERKKPPKARQIGALSAHEETSPASGRGEAASSESTSGAARRGSFGRDQPSS